MKDKTQLPFILFITFSVLLGGNISHAADEMDPYGHSNEYDQVDSYPADEPDRVDYDDYNQGDQGHMKDTYADDYQAGDDYNQDNYDRDVASEAQEPLAYQEDNYYEPAPEPQESLPPEYINNTDY